MHKKRRTILSGHVVYIFVSQRSIVICIGRVPMRGGDDAGNKKLRRKGWRVPNHPSRGINRDYNTCIHSYANVYDTYRVYTYDGIGNRSYGWCCIHMHRGIVKNNPVEIKPTYAERMGGRGVCLANEAFLEFHQVVISWMSGWKLHYLTRYLEFSKSPDALSILTSDKRESERVLVGQIFTMLLTECSPFSIALLPRVCRVSTAVSTNFIWEMV